MSRCFPYTLMRNGVPGEALIEPIKLQTGKEKSKTGKSKEKREKKEKRTEKKRNEQLSKVGDAKISEAEKSDVTEEHGQAMDSCYLSDSTRSSNKRKRHNPPSTPINSSPSTSSCSLSHGNILRIRLREPGVSLIEDQQCTTSGTLELPSKNKISHSTKPHKDESKWAQLMDVLVPQIEHKDYGDEWLREAKPTKRCRSDNDGVLCNRSASLTLWPSAHYLPVADIHALPYTVLF